MDEKSTECTRSIEALGIIVPEEWDPAGRPNAWILSTYDENYYEIDRDTGEGRSMASLEGRTIRVSGQLTETRTGRLRITVEKYTLVNDSNAMT